MSESDPQADAPEADAPEADAPEADAPEAAGPADRGAHGVLFVCRHGAAKSVLAAAELERIAAERGLGIKAGAGGIEPDAEIAPAVLSLLPDKAGRLRAQQPHRVAAAEVRAAWLTVTFNVDEAELPSRPARVVTWDDVPPVSERPADARDVIDRHILELLESLGEGSVPD